MRSVYIQGKTVLKTHRERMESKFYPNSRAKRRTSKEQRFSQASVLTLFTSFYDILGYSLAAYFKMESK